MNLPSSRPDHNRSQQVAIGLGVQGTRAFARGPDLQICRAGRARGSSSRGCWNAARLVGFLRARPTTTAGPHDTTLALADRRVDLRNRRHHLRPGAAAKGQRRYFRAVKVEAIHVETPEQARDKDVFDKLTPRYPMERLGSSNLGNLTPAMDLRPERQWPARPHRGGTAHRQTVLLQNRQRHRRTTPRSNSSCCLGRAPGEVTAMQRT